MALTPEQVEELKDQLREQVQSLPEDKKSAALQQIDELSEEALETMVQQQRAQNAQGNQKTIFRMIVDKDIKSYEIAENKEAIAILDINPISKGHCMILPKEMAKTAKEIPTQAFSLAKRITEKIISKLGAKNTELQTETKFGETVIHLLPIYDKPVNLGSPRQKASDPELEKVWQQIRIVKKPKIEKIKIRKPKVESNSLPKIPRRIP